MEGKWTKGEWEICGDDVLAGGYFVATVHDNNGAPKNKANARLIAQAPAMAEALEDAQKRLRGAGMLGGADDPVNVVLTAIKGE